MKKKMIVGILAATLVMSMNMTAFAGEWQKNSEGWWWMEENGTYPVNSWEWIDGNKDGIAECYYFNNLGYNLQNVVTPDGYTVNADGAWTVDGMVQTQSVGISNSEIQAEDMNGIYATYRAESGEYIILSEENGVPVCKFYYQMNGKTEMMYTQIQKIGENKYQSTFLDWSLTFVNETTLYADDEGLTFYRE